jgi:hypothetical protein
MLASVESSADLKTGIDGKTLINTAIKGFAALVFGCGTYYLFTKLNNQFKSRQDEKVDTIDPRVNKIMNFMLKSQLFKKILSEHKLLQRAKIQALTPEECIKKDVKNASLIYTAGSLFSNEYIEILFDSSLPLIEQVRGVLIEFCNALQVQEFVKLDSLAKEGRLTRDRYIYFKEQTEWKACQPAFEIAEAIDALNLFDNKTIFSLVGKMANQNFDLYLQIQYSSGHSARYGETWDAIAK